MTNSATLVVEVLTEELPPKALKSLGDAFADTLAEGLERRGFLSDNSVIARYATPRRLAVAITHVAASQTPPARAIPLLPVNVAFDAEGRPTDALQKALKAKAGVASAADISSDRLERRIDGKLERVFYMEAPAAVPLHAALDEALHDAIDKLPIPKVMSYARDGGYYNDVRFVRPAHRLVALHGADIVPVTALGLDAGRTTEGHRFLGRRELDVARAEAYAPALEAEATTVARRRQDANPHEQCPHEHDPQHRPGSKKPGLRDHGPAIGSGRRPV